MEACPGPTTKLFKKGHPHKQLIRINHSHQPYGFKVVKWQKNEEEDKKTMSVRGEGRERNGK